MNKRFWDIWTSYAVYYFGKVNLSIVMPVLLATYGLSKYDLGFVASGFFFSYAIGQFVHGHISEKYNPFVYIALGLIGSAIMNLFLGFSAGFFWLLFIGEVMDGGFQSMGWSSCVRATSEMSRRREKETCILGTSYQIGNSIAWLVSAFMVGRFGWKWGFWTAGIIMFLRGITLLINSPKLKTKPFRLKQQIKDTLKLPIVISGVSLGLLNMVRYGVIIWIPTYLFEVQHLPITNVGLKIFLIPIAGCAGTLIYNKLNINRDAVTVIFLACVAFLFVIFRDLRGLASVIALLLSGFFIYGPHVFLVSTFPSRFVDKKTVASSTGFIDGVGYVGAILIGIIVPFLLKFGWNTVFIFWAGISLLIAVLVSLTYITSKISGRKKIDVLGYK